MTGKANSEGKGTFHHRWDRSYRVQIRTFTNDVLDNMLTSYPRQAKTQICVLAR